MSIIQMLFLGGKLPIVLDPYRTSSAGTRPRVTVINPDEVSVSLGASVYSVTAEVWGGGGASGSAFQGRSGAGGGGGYASAIIPTRDLSINELHLRVAGGGGGISINGGEPGGSNVYYDQPLDEYVGVNTATIQFFGSSSVASSPTYSSITSVASTSVKSDISYSDIISIASTSIKNTVSYADITSIGSTSIKNTISYAGITSAGSASVKNTISYADITSIGSTNIKNTISYAGITSVGSASIRDDITYSSVTSVGSTGVKNVLSYPAINYIDSTSVSGGTTLDLSGLGLQVDDIVLVASVCDQGTLTAPTDYTEISSSTGSAPSYFLSYIRITNVGTQTIINSLPEVSGRVVAHTASVYRGVNTGASPLIIGSVSTGTGDPNSLSINTDTPNCMAVSFGFVDETSVLDADITAPSGYTKAITQAVGTATGNEATIMSAYRTVSTAGAEDPGAFTVTSATAYAAITIGLRPEPVLSTAANQLNLPSGIQTNDIILVASVSDGGTLATPSGYTSISSSTAGAPSYQLSYKRVGAIPDTQVTGLTATTLAGFDAAHVALVFRGAITTGTPFVTNGTPASVGTGNPNSPSILVDTFNYTSVSFGFLDNKSISDATITAPSGYTKAITQAVGTDSSATTEATIMTAYRLLSSFKGTEDPGAFSISSSPTDANVAITVGLKPEPTVVTDASTLSLPSGIQTNDIILVASVSDNGTLATPSGYTSISSSTAGAPSYQLSYKRVGAIPDTQVSSLSSNITDSSGVKNDVAHVALVFRGVVSTGTPFVTNSATGAANPDPPSITTNTINFTSVAFGFLDDKSITTITPPTGYTTARNQAVGTNASSIYEATIMSAYKSLNTFGVEDPGTFTGTGVTGNNVAVTVGLRPQPTTVVDARTLPLPSGADLNDIILVSSVCNNGTLATPAGYTSISSSTGGGPSYQLSYKRITGSVDTQVTGLTSITSSNGIDFDVAHTATIFRGVTSGDPLVFNSNTGTGNPDSPSITPNTTKCVSVSFGFLENLSATTISPPSGYTTLVNQEVGTAGITTTQATIMSAYRQLTILSEDPGAFTVSGATVSNSNAAVTVGLRPQPTTIVDARTLSLPTTQQNDIILVSSVCNSGTLATPTGYTLISSSTGGGPSYQLSYKRVGASPDTQVTGLTSITSSSGIDFDVAHTAAVFRGAVVSGTPIISNNNTGTGNPNSPAITPDTTKFMSVSFGFLDDISATSITPPSGYTALVNQEVGTTGITTTQATIMSSYKELSILSEDPGAFNVSGVTASNSNAAVTVGLKPQPTTVVDARTLSLPSTQENDIILLSSVCNSGTVATPAGYTLISSSSGGGPSYQLSYKRVGASPDTQVTGLTSITTSSGIDFDVAHTATVFRGAVVSGTPIVSSNNTGSGNPNSPAINVDTINYTAVSFGFLDNVSATSITPPSGYTTSVNQEVGTAGITTTQATVMSAYKQLTILSEDPGAFTGVSGTNAAVTVGLKPQPTTVIDARTLPLPSGLQQDDIILLSSVCNSGTLTTPAGYTTISSSTTGGPSYQLSYKRITSSVDTQVTGLTSITSSSGINFDVAHAAAIFRGVTPGEPLVSNSNTGGGNPDSPVITADTANYASVSFGFLDNVSSTSITPPTGYSSLVNQEVGTVGITTTQATIISAYKSLNISGSEDPGAFTGVSGTNAAVTVGLRPKQTISTNANALTLPSPLLQTDDVILVASVSDGGTLATPSGYTSISSSTTGGPSYQLSYKRLTSSDLSNPTEYSVTGLTATGTIQGSPGAGETAGVSHIATVFRGVSTTGVGIATSNVLTGTGTPDPPAITSDTVNFMSVAFGFLDDKSITSITPPTNYTTAINQAVGTDSTGTTQATIMSAYRSLSSAASEDPGTFNIGGSTDDYVAITVGLRPQLNLTANTDIITLPPGLETDDIILVASVSDGGTMNIPSGYTSISSSSAGAPSYQLSYKRVGATPDTQVTGLSPSGLTDTGSAGGSGNPAGVAHIALIFRGTSTTINPRITTSTGNNTAPNPPSISSLINGDAVVAFGFLDDISDTSITAPSGYTVARNQAVGSDLTSNLEATLMSAYRILSSTSGTEDPGAFGSSTENNVAISLALRPQTNNKFSSRTGGCGGSGGGYSGVFYGGTDQSNRIPLIVVGGGGGGGGACVATSLGGFISTAVAGSGAPGGGTIAAAGGNGSLIFDSGISNYRLAGSGGGGGGDGITVFGGSSGKTWSFPGVVSTGTNPGEVGVLYSTASVSGFYTGGRGANSPYNDLSAIPLYGANSTGGWLRGSGGGSSRTSSGIIPVPAPTDCGGAGGAGYYGGGGGGSGYGGGGGGGGGGSSYIDSNLSTLSNNSGIGTVPGNTESLNYINGVGYGGTSVLGLGIADVIGNSGGPGMIVLTLSTL